MNTRISFISKAKWLHLFAGLVGGMAFSSTAVAAAFITMNMETQALDLDSGTVQEVLTASTTQLSVADIRLAYNADRVPHAVVVPNGEKVQMAFVANVGFDGVWASDLAGLTFSSAPIDLPFTANDCVVILTDRGTYFRLGNAVESGMSITFHYAPLQ